MPDVERPYGATAAFAGDRCEIHRWGIARTDGELLCRSRFRVKFREVITPRAPQSSKRGERRESTARESVEGTGRVRTFRGRSGRC